MQLAFEEDKVWLTRESLIGVLVGFLDSHIGCICCPIINDLKVGR